MLGDSGLEKGESKLTKPGINSFTVYLTAVFRLFSYLLTPVAKAYKAKNMRIAKISCVFSWNTRVHLYTFNRSWQIKTNRASYRELLKAVVLQRPNTIELIIAE